MLLIGNKYFEPSSNNPIPSNGIKKHTGSILPDLNNPAFQQNQPQNIANTVNNSDSTTVQQPEVQYPVQQNNQNQGFNQSNLVQQEYTPQVPLQPQYSQQINPLQYQLNQQMNMNPPQPMGGQIQGLNYPNLQQDLNQRNLEIENHKKVIEMYQGAFDQILNFQK